MGNLIIPILFIVVAGIFSLISKIQEQREREQRRQARDARRAETELPEATRRQLFGSPQGPPVARPAARPQAAPQRREWKPPTAVPRDGREGGCSANIRHAGAG